MNKNGQQGLIITVAVLIVFFFGAMIVFFLGFDTVDANHIGVKIKFGNILGTMQSGMQWTGLFTHVEEYDMRTRKLIVEMQGVQSAVDKTGQAVFGTIDVNFRIKPNAETVLNLYKNIGSNNAIVDRLNIEPIVREGYKQATSQYDALEVATDKREAVKEEAIRLIKAHFPIDYFELQNVVITNIDFSQGFKDAIEQKKVSIQNKEKEQNQLEVVKFQQQQEIEKYKALAEQNRLQYQAETEKLKAQQSALTPQLVQKLWIDKWDGKLPTSMLTTPESANFLMQLPNINQKS